MTRSRQATGPLFAPLMALALAGCPSTPRAPTPPADGPAASSTPGRTVVILSLDGFRHDYPERRATPGFDRLAREGARVMRLAPCFPSQTFPAHACLATGVRSDRHGIINNRFRDRAGGPYRYEKTVGWYDAPPLWIHAQRHGARSHVLAWVGSQGIYDGVEPTLAVEYREVADAPDHGKLETIAGWLDAPDPPGLIMSYLHGCDRAGHEHGPASADVDACIDRVDGELAGLLDAIATHRDRVTLFVVADHGMTPTLGRIDPWQVVARAGLPGGDSAEVIATGPVAHVYLSPGADPTPVEAALKALPHTTLYRGDGLPAPLRYHRPGRTGDLVLFAEPGHHFAKAEDGQGPTFAPDGPRGHHGHDPQLPDMGAIFFAWGAGIRPGTRLPTADSVDLVPTACHVLGIPPPPEPDGRVLDGLLTE